MRRGMRRRIKNPSHIITLRALVKGLLLYTAYVLGLGKFALKSISPFQLKISPQTATSAALPPLLQNRSLPTEIPQSRINTRTGRIEKDQMFPTFE